jgi:hypothetical protein
VLGRLVDNEIIYNKFVGSERIYNLLKSKKKSENKLKVNEHKIIIEDVCLDGSGVCLIPYNKDKYTIVSKYHNEGQVYNYYREDRYRSYDNMKVYGNAINDIEFIDKNVVAIDSETKALLLFYKQ